MARPLDLLVAFSIVLCSRPAFADYTVDLGTKNSIPSYCQEGLTWCGAAIGEMILEGYPGGVKYVHPQSYIMGRIQAHKDDTPAARKKWATDPDALRDTLQDLGGGGGVSWRSEGNAQAQSLTYDVLYSMANTDYPAAALIFFGLHWIMIEKFVTDKDPRSNNPVELKTIGIVNPLKSPCPFAGSGGLRSVMVGSTWYASYLYSRFPVSIIGSKWKGKYVAVAEGEAAPTIGMALAEMQPTEGKVISNAAALKAARGALDNLDLLKNRPYDTLGQSDPLDALLVNLDENAYYIVPFAYADSTISIGAVIVNAYSGQFQEAAVFPKPIRFLPKDEAIRLALGYVCNCSYPPESVLSKLIFKPSDASQTRFLPVWQLVVGSEVVYVSQEGKVFRNLPQSVPGG